MAETYQQVEHERNRMRTALNEIHSWLVCWPIATAEDMGQSFGEMEQIVTNALGIKE